jgi:hypothetical protein
MEADEQARGSVPVFAGRERWQQWRRLEGIRSLSAGIEPVEKGRSKNLKKISVVSI